MNAGPITSSSAAVSQPTSQAGAFETRVGLLGLHLANGMARLMHALPGTPRGPASIGRLLGVDKVLASRVAKAAGQRDPIAALLAMPGPAPLRRYVRAAAKRGADKSLVEELLAAIGEFENLIEHEAGDRSALDAILSAFLPASRTEFELRRKQAAFRAMSQLLGVEAELNLSAVFLYPSPDGLHMDVVWLVCLLRLQRLRPGARIKFTSKRLSDPDEPRHAKTLDGTAVDDLNHLRMLEFCDAPPAELLVEKIGSVVHYTVADHGFGPQAVVDLIVAEVNHADLPIERVVRPGRLCHLYAGISTPVKTLVLDVFLHDSLFPGVQPQLFIYDTAFEGIADPNNAARDIDRLPLSDTTQPLGGGIMNCRVPEAPRYADVLRTICAKLRWNPERFRGYRCRSDYPIYGTQISMAFAARERPAP